MFDLNQFQFYAEQFLKIETNEENFRKIDYFYEKILKHGYRCLGFKNLSKQFGPDLRYTTFKNKVTGLGTVDNSTSQFVANTLGNIQLTYSLIRPKMPLFPSKKSFTKRLLGKLLPEC